MAVVTARLCHDDGMSAVATAATDAQEELFPDESERMQLQVGLERPTDLEWALCEPIEHIGWCAR